MAAEHSAEEWRPVKGHEGRYEVSSLGRVRSLIRAEPRILKPTRDWKGYHRVSLSGKTRTVHLIVLEAFHGPRPDGLQASHLNDDKDNNTSDNLAWETPRKNYDRRAENGGDTCGERSASAILTENDVREIRQLYAAGENYTDLGRRFGVHLTTIRKLIRGESWKTCK